MAECHVNCHDASVAMMTDNPHYVSWDIMQLEYYLSKILRYLMDDGLQQCRLVCRQWNEVCKKLPLRINVEPAGLSTAICTFPNAAHISVKFCTNAPLLESQLLRRLLRFNGLQSVILKLSANHISECIQSAIGVLLQIPELYLILWTRYTDLSFPPLLEVMTNLVELTLIEPDTHPQGKPLTMLKNIRSLNVPEQMLLCEDGSPAFPSLTGLTELHITPGDNNNAGRRRVLTVAGQFAATLQSLTLNCTLIFDDSIDWRQLKQFVALESISFLHLMEHSPVLYRTLVEMPQILELDLGSGNDLQRETALCVYALTQLKSLILRSEPGRGGDAATCGLSRLTRLTSLTIEYVNAGDTLRFLSQLVYLEIRADEMTEIDVAQSLLCLSRLETLKLLGGITVKSEVLCCLTKLDTLVLGYKHSTDWMLEELRTLSSLTVLSLRSCSSSLDCTPLLLQLGALSNLTGLFVNCTKEYPCDFLLEGSLPRLRRLHVSLFGRDRFTRQELKRRFPNAKIT